MSTIELEICVLTFGCMDARVLIWSIAGTAMLICQTTFQYFGLLIFFQQISDDQALLNTVGILNELLGRSGEWKSQKGIMFMYSGKQTM